MIKHNGYYRSSKINFQDWHSGNKIWEGNYIYYFFDSNNRCLRYIDKGDKIAKEVAIRLLQEVSSTYKVADTFVIINLKPGSKLFKEIDLKIISQDVLKETSMNREYHFHPWEE